MQAVFGDYAILHDLRSNISFRTTEYEQEVGTDGNVYERDATELMCVRKDVFLNLCELYPKTEENRAMEMRFNKKNAQSERAVSSQ